MNTRAFLLAAAAAFLWHTPAMAQQSVEERLMNMEKRIRQLEKRVSAQDEMIVEKDKQIAKLTKGGKWSDAVKVGGAIELLGTFANPAEGDSTSDVSVDTLDLVIGAKLSDWVSGETALTRKGDSMDLDTATLTFGPPDGAWSLTGGQLYLPFGAFETNLVSDPLSLDIGETRQTALQFNLASGGLSGAVFIFKGDSPEDGLDRVQGAGAAVGYSMEKKNFGFGMNLSYINDLGDSDTLQGVIADSIDRAQGISASAKMRIGNITFLGEYLGALDEFHAEEVAFMGRGAKPSGWMVETVYGFALIGKAATLAVSYQTTDEALALELPKKRVLFGLSAELTDGVFLGVEWARDNDYGVGEGGTGKDSDTFSVLLAAGF